MPPAMISGVWGYVTNKHLAGIPGTGFLLNTQSYVRLHCLPVVLRVFGRGSVYSCRIDKPLIKSDYEIKLKQQEIMQEVGNANMLTKALIDRLINKVYVFPGDRIEIEYATQDFLETKESEKEV